MDVYEYPPNKDIEHLADAILDTLTKQSEVYFGLDTDGKLCVTDTPGEFHHMGTIRGPAGHDSRHTIIRYIAEQLTKNVILIPKYTSNDQT